MRKRARIVALGVLVVAALWLTIWQVRRQHRVTFQGKTAEEWFREFCAAESHYGVPQRYRFSGSNMAFVTPDLGRWFRDPAADGLRGLGTNAALYLAREFRRDDPSWAPGYWKFFVKLPGPLKAMSPKPPVPRSYVRLQIASALQAMGADGAAAVPSLIEGLKGPDRSTRSIIMRTLRSLPRQPGAYDSVLDDLARRAQFPAALEVVENLGIRTQKAGAILGEALAAGDLETRRRSVRQLRYLGPNAAFAIPALILTLTNGDSELRYSATSALADIGPAARSAVPALGRLANDSSEMVQHAAARALLAIGPEADEIRKPEK